ncbi:MAG: hypothetical protein AAGF11_28945 [Myxococcota bacterium]
MTPVTSSPSSGSGVPGSSAEATTGLPGDTTMSPTDPSTTMVPDDTSEDSDTTTAGAGDPGDWLLTVDRGSSPPRLVRIDLTGATLEVCALASVVDYASIAFARDGTLYGLNIVEGRIDRINPCNCSFQFVGATSVGPLSLGLSAEDEEFLGIDPALDALVRVDQQTGLGTVIGPLGFFFGPSAIAWSEALGQPYAIEADNDFLFTIDPVTGAATDGPMLSADLTAPGLAIHPNDSILYACDANTLYTIDPATGLMTQVSAALALTGGCQTLTPPQTAIDCIDSL